jgi:hypothetical protein
MYSVNKRKITFHSRRKEDKKEEYILNFQLRKETVHGLDYCKSLNGLKGIPA